jgi:hypothetical protein
LRIRTGNDSWDTWKKCRNEEGGLSDLENIHEWGTKLEIAEKKFKKKERGLKDLNVIQMYETRFWETLKIIKNNKQG